MQQLYSNSSRAAISLGIAALFLFFGKQMPLDTSTLKEIVTEAPPVAFNTTYYEDEHGAKPSPNKVGDWSFLPPRHLGKRPLLFLEMTYAAAKKAAIDEIGDRPAYGEFILMP